MHVKGKDSGGPMQEPSRSRGRVRAGVAIVVSAVVLASLPPLAGAARQGAGSARSTGWISYSDAHGVSFLHPASWTVKAGSSALFIYIDPASGVPFRRNINLLAQVSEGQPITAANYLQTNLAEINQDHGTVSQRGPLSFDGTPGYRLLWAASISGVAYEFLSQWTIRHGEAWLVTYTSDPSRFASALPMVERLVAGLKLPG